MSETPAVAEVAAEKKSSPVLLSDTGWTSAQVGAFLLAVGGILFAILGMWVGLRDQVRDSQTRIAIVESKVNALLRKSGIDPDLLNIPSAPPNSPTPTRGTNP